MSKVLVEKPRVVVEKQGAVTLVTINRPEVHNAVDGETAVALAEAIDAFGADDEARVMVLTGAGERAFCAGADLLGVGDLMRHAHVDRAGPMGYARLDPGKPTIAAVNGYCFAGGMELACWCDFRIAAENAEFGALNRRWGVPFVDGGTQRFPRIMGLGNALWMVETGVRVDARRALAMGLVQDVVAVGAALEASLELARHVAGYPQASVRADRAAMLATYGQDLDEGLLLEARLGRGAAGEQEVRDRLARFAAGDRPASPRPAS